MVGSDVMRVVSVNVGLPRRVTWKGETVTTGIFKQPVDGPVRVAGVNLEGDRQADLTVHGGPDKAVYVYPAEHYPYWEAELGRDLPWGMFGENLTVQAVPLENETTIGDRLRIGSAEFVVTQPRLPCFKLGVRFDDAGMVRRFLAAGRSGYYLRIATEGYVAAGDQIDLLARRPARVLVSEITRLFTRDQNDIDGLRRVLAVDALPADLRPFFAERLQQVDPRAFPRPTRLGRYSGKGE
jgi:MOSC domain-containing protein YiiM